MKYCRRCVLPDTRPNLIINDDGICNACKNSEQKDCGIDWRQREKMFVKVVEFAKTRSRGYDCIVPVSGGKDSTWQVVKCLEYGLTPLAVTWRPPARTKLGQQNLDNLVRLGVDHIDYQINPNVEKKFMYKALCKYGSSAIPMHLAMFNIPPAIAVRFDIPLIVWGENSAFEYGSAEESLTGFRLDDRWFKKFGVTHGTRAEDWLLEGFTKKELTPYFGPVDKELREKNINAIFLGYYFKWDVENSLKVARENGFKIRDAGPKIGLYNYADIDDDFISIHHYFKWFKFGFTRLFDNLSLEIRNSRLTREQALKILKEEGEQRPEKDIERFCEFLNITEEYFNQCADKFRNKDIWINQGGKWKIKDFIIKDWRW